MSIAGDLKLAKHMDELRKMHMVKHGFSLLDVVRYGECSVCGKPCFGVIFSFHEHDTVNVLACQDTVTCVGLPFVTRDVGPVSTRMRNRIERGRALLKERARG